MSSTFLTTIGQLTEKRNEAKEKLHPLEFLKGLSLKLSHQITPFELALNGKTSIIAEVKKSSPSLGLINHSIDAVDLGLAYFAKGAAAVSVLTEPQYFGGDPETILKIREKNQKLPILQKDFVIDPYQIYEARVLGADCVLLIVALLGKEKTKEFYQLAKSLGLSVLVEVHNEEELEIAQDMGSNIIGINNRNLHTLEIDINTSKQLIKKIKRKCLLVSESGLSTREELQELKSLGFNAFLIGSSLMKESAPEEKLKTLVQGLL